MKTIMPDSVKCPNCNDVGIEMGAIPPVYRFLSLEFDKPVNQGRLYSCPACYLYFRFPCLSEAELTKMYRQEGETYWKDEAGDMIRHDTIQIVKELDAEVHSIKSILDVGCYTGLLLVKLRDLLNIPELTLFGVEPNLKAARIARESGINILGDTIEDLKNECLFDVIILVDVFEHIQNFSSRIKRLAEILNPGGTLIVVTGALDSEFLANRSNLSYYVAYPEHIAFMTEKHAKWIAEKSLLKLCTYRFIRHGHPTKNILSRCKYALRSLLSRVLNADTLEKQLRNRNLGIRLNSIRGAGISNFMEGPDHVLVRWENSI